MGQLMIFLADYTIFRWGNINMNEWTCFYYKLWKTYSVRKFNPIEASSVIDFQVDGARHLLTFSSAHEKKQGFLASSYSCTCHIFLLLRSVDGVVKPWREHTWIWNCNVVVVLPLDLLVCEARGKLNCIHGHRTLKEPHPVWSAQLTRVPPS